jgi:uncharacterized protein YqeY
VAVLRTTLAALDNAEAVPADEYDVGTLALEATPVGVGAREAARRQLSEEDVERVVRAEIGDRLAAAEVYDDAGRHEHARRLREEADVLASAAGLSDLPPASR